MSSNSLLCNRICPLNKEHINSLDFAVGSCFSKIFCIKSRETITECMRLFNCQSVRNVSDKRMRNFMQKYSASSNSLCKLFVKCLLVVLLRTYKQVHNVSTIQSTLV